MVSIEMCDRAIGKLTGERQSFDDKIEQLQEIKRKYT